MQAIICYDHLEALAGTVDHPVNLAFILYDITHAYSLFPLFSLSLVSLQSGFGTFFLSNPKQKGVEMKFGKTLVKSQQPEWERCVARWEEYC